MNLKAILFSFGFLFSMYGRCQTSMSAGAERLLNYIEQHITEVAEAMPENRFDFTPDSLHIPGSRFESVRSFAGQIKHLATDNFFIWTAITGDNMPSGIDDVNGPANLKTKTEILTYLKQSFAAGHKAIATLTTTNAMDMMPFRGNKLPRVDLAFYALTHANEHYGQLVIYLRMCGIIPPASRPDRPQ
ncbi:MAG TPA: DinB family protein [Puia sp.]|nr:DinB family protein [Puia sp.]